VSGSRERPEPREVELKFGVADASAFEALARHLTPGRPLPAAARQTNHFFETPGRGLARAGFALRLRLEQGRARLTLKGAAAAGSSDVLAVRAEVEIEVPPATAEAILAGRVSALEPLLELDGPPRDLLSGLDAALGGARPEPVGSFTNERIRLGPVALEAAGPPLEVLFELDRTSLPGGRVDHEVEVELADEADAERAHRACTRLFESAGVRWFPVPSKAARFFAALPAP